MEKETIDIRNFLEESSIEDLQEFHRRLSTRNGDNGFTEFLNYVSKLIDEKQKT